MKHHFVGVRPLNIQFRGTPITDDTFIKQGWTKIDCIDDDNDSRFDDYDGHPLDEFFDNIGFQLPDSDYNIDDYDDDDDDARNELGNLFDVEGAYPPYPNKADWEKEYHFWVLKIPKDWIDDNTLTLISTTSDHHIPGFSKGEYIVELYQQDGLGTCLSEEEIEILYTALSGEYIYD